MNENLEKKVEQPFDVVKQEFLNVSAIRKDIYLTPIIIAYFSEDNRYNGLNKVRDYLYFKDVPDNRYRK